VLLLLPHFAAASEGDASAEFQGCEAVCQYTGCLPPALQKWNPEVGGALGDGTAPAAAGSGCSIACPRNAPRYQPPLALRLARWGCADDCAYHCMWAAERRRAAAGEGPVWKYTGKWPFIRVLGAQEIASVVFSVANLLAHVAGLRRYAAALRAARAAGATGGGGAAKGSGGGSSGGGAGGGHYPYAWIWWLYGAASLNAWVWSSVFHVRDIRVTERLDYFSADALVAAGALAAAVRTLRLSRPSRALPAAAAAAAGLLWHVRYMAFVKFDYGYNMAVCIAAGITTAIAWVAWAAAARHPARRRLFAFVAAVHLAMALEVLDFPPLLGLLDAHALWHAATALLMPLWYDFVVADVAWVAAGGGGNGSGGDGEGGGGGSGALARAPSPVPSGRRRAAAADGKRES
jgi:uncharacterized membrane protein YgcG